MTPSSAAAQLRRATIARLANRRSGGLFAGVSEGWLIGKN